MVFNNMFDVGKPAVVMMMPVVVMVMIVVVRMLMIVVMNGLVMMLVMLMRMFVKVFMLIIAMIVRMVMLAMLMRMLVIVLILLLHVIHALLFLAVHRDCHVGPADAALLRRLRLHDHARNPQRVESLHKPIPIRDQLQQRGGKHIAGRTHLTIKIKGSHFNFLS